MLSVITTNVFPGHIQIEILVKNLSVQTLKEFEWILVDGHYASNKTIVSDLCKKYGILNFLHVPMCGARHIPRRFHWEIYNNALLLTSNELFVRMGVFRWFSPRTLEYAANEWISGRFIEFPQITKTVDEFTGDANDICRKHPISDTFSRKNNKMQSHCGMFSYARSRMISIGGNDEVSTSIYHHEDLELNSRWATMKNQISTTISNSLLRIDHSKGNEMREIILGTESPAQYPCGNEDCIISAPSGYDMTKWNGYDLTRWKKPGIKLFEYRGFEWVKCLCCGAMAPNQSQKYLDWLEHRENAMSSVGVGGIAGRNLSRLDEDLSKCKNLSSKLDLLTQSHTMTRYLEEDE